MHCRIPLTVCAVALLGFAASSFADEKPILLDCTGPNGATADSVKAAQLAWATFLKLPKEMDIRLADGVTMTFVLVPPGRFMMGASDGEKNDNTALANELPRHEVEITQPMYVSKYATTKKQFASFVAAGGYTTEAENAKYGFGLNIEKGKWEKGPYTWKKTSLPQEDDHPAVMVTWNDAQKFCSWLKANAGLPPGTKRVRLLREAEWEYSCRAGTRTRHYAGDKLEDLAMIANVYDASGKSKFKMPWTPISADDGYAFTAPVGKFKANALGLHDMLGNVWQWCQDRKRKYTSEKQVDPDGGNDIEVRAFRGGSFDEDPHFIRAAIRGSWGTDYRNFSLGFRAVLAR